MALTQVRRQALGFAAVVAVVAAAVLVSPDPVFDTVEAVTADPLLAGAVFAGIYVVRPLFAWPTTVVAVAVGYVFGPTVGVPLALAGTVASAWLPFAAARYFRTDAGFFGRVGESGERFFDATGDVRGMLVSRLVPAPSDPVSAAAGLSGVPPRAFVLGTALGEVPWIAAAVLAGSSFDSLVGGEFRPDWWLVAVALVAGLALLAGPAYRTLRRRSGQ